MEQTKYSAPENEIARPAIPNMDALLQNPLKDEKFVQDYLALLERYGLDDDAADLQNLAATVDHQTDQLHHILHKMMRLQKEVDELNSDTPITAQFKKEMNTRCFNIYTAIGDMYLAIQDARSSIKEACKDAIQNFKEYGISAFHRGCAAIYGIGERFCNACVTNNEKQHSNYKDIIVRVDSLAATSNLARQQRSALTRVLFGMKPKEAAEPRESMLLTAIRNKAKENMDMCEDASHNWKESAQKYSAKRERHLAALEREPNRMRSFDDMVSDAQAAAKNQAKKTDKQKTQDGPNRD